MHAYRTVKGGHSRILVASWMWLKPCYDGPRTTNQSSHIKSADARKSYRRIRYVGLAVLYKSGIHRKIWKIYRKYWRRIILYPPGHAPWPKMLMGRFPRGATTWHARRGVVGWRTQRGATCVFYLLFFSVFFPVSFLVSFIRMRQTLYMFIYFFIIKSLYI